MKFLFGVHRAFPYPGGSEIYVHNMAKECVNRGHDVTILAGEHKGDIDGIKITNDANIVTKSFDLIIVHGAGPAVQNWVLSNASIIQNQFHNKILYLIVLPNHTPLAVQALKDCKYIGCSTEQDYIHCIRYNVSHKTYQINHGIDLSQSIGKSGFRNKYNLNNKRIFLSCGGYWPNKKMKELAHLFENANLENSVLVTTGYENRMNLMPTASKNVIPLLIDDRNELLSAIADADCMVMHSSEEGFGLVLLESMVNKTPWIARRIAGAKQLENFGYTYNTDSELLSYLHNFDNLNFDLNLNYNHVIANHLIQNTVDNIEGVLK